MTTRITVLVDDRKGTSTLGTEHGLSMWIEHDGHKLLFDTGTSGQLLVDNAAALGVRLDEAEAVCLSHGHYDHTGGLATVLPLLSGARLLAHPKVFVPKLAQRATGWQAIGTRVSEADIASAGLTVHLADGPQEVFPGVMLTGEVEREPSLVPHTPHLCVEDGGGPKLDTFPDDQAIALRHPDGLIVISGCAHAGIINHCRAAQRLMGDERLRAVVGGFHLVGASAELMAATINAFRELAPQVIHPCHCTGDPAMATLAREFPETCTPIASGATLEW